MWILKIKVMHKDCPIVPLCKKFNVTTYAFPAGASGGIFKKNGKNYLTAFHFISGEEKNKKLFFENLKKDKRIEKLEIQGNRFSYLLNLTKKEEQVQLYYDSQLIFLKPVINSSEGFEYWEVGSWSREALTDFMNKVKKHMDYFELLKLGKSEFSDLYFPMILPKLSEKQKKAIELANKRGYYFYPRKVELKDLAKEMGISIPTFQEHIRKAEIKLLPFIIEQSL
ncbi:MAG: helix-turn-helix domain-containing protein [Nanoarchaeota archaeon]|nr:helix-turn-helix domain-containing protein [Nanoarchaeota archaeon]